MKKNVLSLLILLLLLITSIHAQRGVRIGYIDTEYILQNVPEYQEATAQLDAKVKKWKKEIDSKLSAIEQKRKDLSNEKALLTKELIEEREEDIAFEEKEILDYQQNRFGPNGDLMIQKKQLIQPIQDQIFAAVQTIAANKKYDFIFDKSADVVMLFSANRFDISELVLRNITRASKRKQANTKAERKAAEQEDILPEVNEELEKRQEAKEKRRQEILEARAAKKKAAADKRAKLIEEREKEKQAKLDARKNSNKESTDENNAEGNKEAENKDDDLEKGNEEKTPAQQAEEKKQKKIADREARKKALEERKAKILADREAAKQKKLEERKQLKEENINDQEDEEENN